MRTYIGQLVNYTYTIFIYNFYIDVSLAIRV